MSPEYTWLDRLKCFIGLHKWGFTFSIVNGEIDYVVICDCCGTGNKEYGNMKGRDR